MTLRTLIDTAAVLSQLGPWQGSELTAVKAVVLDWHNNCAAALEQAISFSALEQLAEEVLAVEFLLRQLSSSHHRTGSIHSTFPAVWKLSDRLFDRLKRNRQELAGLLRVQRLQRRLHSTTHLQATRWHICDRECPDPARAKLLNTLCGLVLEHLRGDGFQNWGGLKGTRQMHVERSAVIDGNYAAQLRPRPIWLASHE